MPQRAVRAPDRAPRPFVPRQLDALATADLLHERGVLWAPDVVVSAGGIIHATSVELRHESPGQAASRVEGIGDTLTALLSAGRSTGETSAAAARDLAERRIREGLR